MQCISESEAETWVQCHYMKSFPKPKPQRACRWHSVSGSDELWKSPQASMPLLLTLLSSLSAGAGAPEGRPDERDPGSQELLVQQDPGIPQELQQQQWLPVPDPLLPQGRARVGPPCTPVWRVYGLPLEVTHKSLGTQAEQITYRDNAVFLFYHGAGRKKARLAALTVNGWKDRNGRGFYAASSVPYMSIPLFTSLPFTTLIDSHFVLYCSWIGLKCIFLPALLRSLWNWTNYEQIIEAVGW